MTLRGVFWPPPVPVVVAFVTLALFGGGVVVGRVTSPANVQTVTVVKEQERIVWREKTVASAVTVATAEKKQAVRVVTRWLRPDGSTLKLQLRESGAQSSSTSTASTTASTSSSGETARSSESRTVVDLRAPPRFSAQALLGLDLGHGAARRYGAAVNVRIAGPVTVGAFALPGAKMYGAALGITF